MKEAPVIFYPHAQIPWQEQEKFVDPISTADDLNRVLVLLARRLTARLEAGWLGAHAYTASFLRVDGLTAEIAIATSHPLRNPDRIARLLGEKLEQVDPGFGVEIALLRAHGISPLNAIQPELDSSAGLPQAELSELLDQLANRLGQHALWQDMPHASHVPERSVQRALPVFTQPIRAPINHRPPWALLSPRPIRMLVPPEPVDATAALPDDPPAQFRWRGALHRLRTASLPERIAAEWWRRKQDESRLEHDLLRDYYRVEDNLGARFWLFRAGLDASRGGRRWFVHGIFG
jgi:protein ImuB